MKLIQSGESKDLKKKDETYRYKKDEALEGPQASKKL